MGECRNDLGGYFIIDGKEKVIVSQDRIAENKTYVFKDNKLSTYSYIAEIRSVPENIFSPPKLTVLKLIYVLDYQSIRNQRQNWDKNLSPFRTTHVRLS